MIQFKNLVHLGREGTIEFKVKEGTMENSRKEETFVDHLSQGGRGQWAVNYTSLQSFKIKFSY